MNLEQKLESLFTPVLQDLGLDIVRVKISGSQRKVLEIMIERTDNEAVRMEDCVRASREVSAFLDVEDPIEGAYSLEVTSPGLDRPLVKKTDYQRFQGHEIKLETYLPKPDKKRFTGIITEAGEDRFVLTTTDSKEPSTLEFEYSEIKKAKLVPDLDF